MFLQLIKALIIRKEFLKILRLAKCIQISKYCIAFNLTRILHTDMIWIGIHGHYLFLDVLRLLRQINTVAERFAHLCLAINTRQTQACGIVRKNNLRIGKRFAIHRIKLVHDLLTLLNHRHLIFTNRYMRWTESSNICCLTDRICEKSNWNACFKILLFDLCFYCWVTLHSCNCN